MHSGDFIMSLRKLALGLMDQLRVQRNVNDQIFSCCGFYFPAIDTQKTVVKVTLTWSDDAHIFKSIAEPIPLREVSNAINTAITQEVMKTLDFQTTQNNFVIPMSKSYIKNHFGDGAEQHSSGQSVVIINMSQRKVYKHPLHEKEGIRLMQLKDSPTINQCLLPHRKLVCVSPYLVVYFVYDLLHPPILLVDTIRYIVSLTSTVIQSLHAQGIAHLDIRLENIRFNDNFEAVLIDLDRSASLHRTDLKYLKQIYGDSVMYEITEEFSASATLRNIDWRQFGIMVHYILGGTREYDYHHTQPQVQDQFLKKLIYKGTSIGYTMSWRWLCDLFTEGHSPKVKKHIITDKSYML